MAKTTLIHVTATDNELYLIATKDGRQSAEIVHLSSGFNNPVEYKVIPQSILEAGNYTLSIVGINWGGPFQFTVALTQGGPPVVITSGAPANGPVGVTFTKAVPMTV
jgi:hypothetical protein